jgi:hypothetical protein
MAIGINFDRLWTYFMENDPGSIVLLTFAVLLMVFLAKSLAEKSTGPDFQVAQVSTGLIRVEFSPDVFAGTPMML